MKRLEGKRREREEERGEGGMKEGGRKEGSNERRNGAKEWKWKLKAEDASGSRGVGIELRSESA